ncbi:hypothetical protein PRIPAC_80897 [Pristionchus pacificus]|uniref:Uncharacterized protein n=1 Tax=Pristionchus pacificus TaxID=54126 RepID=A0A2A6BYZ4_PRIPA|nr:hypothetical protein PRIPAC_80897 [Pristionchus pacificus]|eukprot:PDM70991.1 hypothetical protein PRIPAC_44387 [Pristionchus pacificus]
MEWFSLPILILFLSSSLSSEICNSDECNEASTFLLSLNDEKDACTDNFAHSCTSNARKIKETADNSNDAKMKNEDRIKFVEYVNSMNEEDVVISGIRKLNQSCMNFNGSLFEDISLNMDQMIKQMEPEHVSGFMTRGIPIYFKTKFVLGRKGANPILHFGNFEEKFFKFKLVDREYYQDFRVYTYNEFVETFSVANWSMASFLDGLASRTSVEHIIVEDPQGIHYAVSILAEMKRNKTLNAYTKEAYLHKISFLHFSKKNMVDFPNPDAPDSTKVDDCLSLVTRYFPFLLRDIEKNTTDRDFIHWVEKATTAVKTTLYKQIDDSDWLEPFDKVKSHYILIFNNTIFLLDIIMKINVFVYNDKNEEKEDGTLGIFN